MSSPDPLAVLEVTARNELESMLMEFDGTWELDSLNHYGERIDSHPDPEYRNLAIAELVKIDLQRSWAAGKGRFIEDYLRQLPRLGNTNSVSAELIAAEYDARRNVDSELSIALYESRFPMRFQEVKQLVSQLMESYAKSSSPTRRTGKELQASIDTSRVEQIHDTIDGKQRERTDDLPVEFGRYRIIKELGSGAMGKVFLAHDSQLDRQVALKTPSFRGTDNDDMVTRFYREARAAAKLHHRNICPIYDVGEIDGRHFISMAFVKGRCMSEFIAPNKLPPQRTSAVLVQRIAVALSEAHKHNVIHRDLKPANIMIDLKKEPIVMDFGLARQMDVESRVTQSGMAVGTPAYMSPEQIRGELDEVDAGADIYALGVILYELLTGRLPFRGPIAKVVFGIVNEEPAAPSSIREGTDPALESICAKMMAKDRSKRFRSMEDVARALKAYAIGEKRSKSANSSSAGNVTDATAATSSTNALTETGALNAFFAAHAEATASGTRIESERPVVSTQDSRPTHLVKRPKPSSSSNGSRRRRRSLFIASGFGGGILLLLGVVIYFNGGKIELDDNADAVVEVKKDGTLQIKPAQQPSPKLAQKTAQQEVQRPTTPARLDANPRLRDVRNPDHPLDSFTIQNEGGGYQFALSPDGRSLVTTGSGSPGRFTLWDTTTGRQIAQVTDPDHAGVSTRSHAFSPDGRRLVYSVDKFVKVIDLQTGAIVQTSELAALPKTAQFPNRPWAAIHYVPPDQQSSQASGGRLRIWDWENDRILYDESTTSARALSISPDGNLLFLNTQNYHVRHAVEWDGMTLSLGQGVRFEATSRVRSPLSFSPDGRYAANCVKSSLGMAVLLDVATGRIVRYLEPELAQTSNQGHKFGANVTFTNDGSKMVTANHLGRIALWDRETGKLIREIANIGEDSGHWSPRLVVSPTGQLIVGTDPIRVYELSGYVAHDSDRAHDSDKMEPLNDVASAPATARETAHSKATEADDQRHRELDLVESESTDDRAIAKQIVDLGGSVQLAGGNNWIEALPEGKVRVEGVSFFRKQKEFDDGHIAMLRKLPNLRTIIFYPNKMTDEGFAKLAEMGNVVENVKVLRFFRAPLGPQGLAALAKLKRLEELTLHHTDLIDDDLKLLAQLPKLNQLTLQQYSKKKFGPAFLTNESLKHLGAVPGLRKLTLMGEQYTDACLVTVADLQIEELWLATPNITELAIKQLREKRPRLGITRFKQSPTETPVVEEN